MAQKYQAPEFFVRTILRNDRIFPTFTLSIHFIRNLESPLDKMVWLDNNTNIK